MPNDPGDFGVIRRTVNALRFRKDDPLRQLHVSSGQRLEFDESALIDGAPVNLEWYLAHPGPDNSEALLEGKD